MTIYNEYFSKMKLLRTGLNQRPLDYCSNQLQSTALPTELPEVTKFVKSEHLYQTTKCSCIGLVFIYNNMNKIC